jgi:putative hydrolase of the HAD superfamily|tara:strand:+ start:646 stop:1338 length:693 start_codon:yes stop_codon:yes gene_type:complete
MKITHVFFDLDRTLWDFDLNSYNTLLDIFHDFSLKDKGIKDPVFFIEQYIKINESLWSLYRDDLITKEDLRSRRFYQTLQEYSIQDLQLAKDIGDAYVKNSPLQTVLFPHTIEILTYLQKKYSLSIITNGFEEVQHIKLKASAIDHFFDHVVTSEAVDVKKPNPIIFQYALDKAKVSAKSSIMIGDDLPVDILGAKSMGMSHVFFNPKKNSHSQKIDFEISCLSDLKNIL